MRAIILPFPPFRLPVRRTQLHDFPKEFPVQHRFHGDGGRLFLVCAYAKLKVCGVPHKVQEGQGIFHSQHLGTVAGDTGPCDRGPCHGACDACLKAHAALPGLQGLFRDQHDLQRPVQTLHPEPCRLTLYILRGSPHAHAQSLSTIPAPAPDKLYAVRGPGRDSLIEIHIGKAHVVYEGAAAKKRCHGRKAAIEDFCPAHGLFLPNMETGPLALPASCQKPCQRKRHRISPLFLFRIFGHFWGVRLLCRKETHALDEKCLVVIFFCMRPYAALSQSQDQS